MRLFPSVARFNFDAKWAAKVALVLLPTLFIVGCQAPQPDLGNRLMAHVALVDSAG